MNDGLTRLNRLDKKWERVTQIGREANKMVEEIVPEVYKDGDVRYISFDVYKAIRSLMDERNKLLGLSEEERRHSTEVVYVGAFGTLTIKETK